jgi:quinol monooxygenase YgiN
MFQTNQRKIVRLTARHGCFERMREALIELRHATVQEPGCVEFDFLQSLTAPHSFLLIEDFASADALEVHMQAAHTKHFFAQELLEAGTPIEKDWLS